MKTVLVYDSSIKYSYRSSVECYQKKLQWPLQTCQNNDKLKVVSFISGYLKYKNTTNKEFRPCIYRCIQGQQKKYICEKHMGSLVAQIIP